MESFFTETLGLSEPLFTYFVLPLLIFLARIMDVSINTVRIIYMLGGRRATSTILGFFEAFVWIIVISQLFQNLDNWICYVAYAGGFATGIFVGMIIEERIAYGKVIVRIITNKDISQLISFLREKNFRFTKVDTEGRDGPSNLVFTVLDRERLDEMLDKLKDLLPAAFYTIESVKAANDTGLLPEERGNFSWSTLLRSVMRK